MSAQFTHTHRYPTSSSRSLQSTAPTSAPTSQPQSATFAPQMTHPLNHQSRISDPDGTATYLRDFNLLAEAAKRAQMACLMRDMEAMGVQ